MRIGHRSLLLDTACQAVCVSDACSFIWLELRDAFLRWLLFVPYVLPFVFGCLLSSFPLTDLSVFLPGDLSALGAVSGA